MAGDALDSAKNVAGEVVDSVKDGSIMDLSLIHI